MNEKFWDILAFTQQVSKLMVSEIRRRASNQSTETASCAIVKFLEIENSEESSNGWMLLSALNLLAAGDTSLIQVKILNYYDNEDALINRFSFSLSSGNDHSIGTVDSGQMSLFVLRSTRDERSRGRRRGCK